MGIVVSRRAFAKIIADLKNPPKASPELKARLAAARALTRA